MAWTWETETDRAERDMRASYQCGQGDGTSGTDQTGTAGRMASGAGQDKRGQGTGTASGDQWHMPFAPPPH